MTPFHPLVAQWFHDTLGAPTAAQRRGWAAIRDGRHTLIAAPTGSGKTLAAFLTAIDDLVREGLQAPLPDEVRVIYVSPLKALSADIHKNLAEPRRGIRELAAAQGLEVPPITAAVRTGDTTSGERAAMLRTPPHILVTTPESLYLLLTSERSRQMLATARTVIVDEIHAVIGTRRGAHLALSLERLQQLAARPLLRLGLSATQKPVDDVARFLVGADATRGACAIVDEGHRRTIDLAVEVPRSPLGAVMAHEVWEEYYDRLAALTSEHKTTLVFVNTRRMAERVARHLSERLGEDAVTAHHGSLSKETRLDAESRLKNGRLKALVATASLELGIDIGHVDLVCQIGSPHRIATLLQRVGRSGHSIAGTPKGRVFPESRDDLVECAALLRAVRRGELDRIVVHDAPLDVLAQQLAAEAACRECGEDDLFALIRRAWPYRALERPAFDAVVSMLSEGYSTRRGRRAALVHRDEVHGILRGRRGSRLLALTSGGAIPEVADYRVILEPDETFVGTLNEDFAIESSGGDIFQLGNASWQITQVIAGTVRVTDAHGAPPTIPFWLGEAPARSDELSKEVSDLRKEAERIIAGNGVATTTEPELAAWLQATTGLCAAGAHQAAAYLGEGYRALGAIPTQESLVFERFFDEAGGMQLVLHAPFGSRINKAWVLALRKRFCRQFNFELQAAATEDALLLSLGPQHSFPLADVFRYLHPATVRDILVQALLDAPLFATRWRWNTTISLAVPRNRGGRKVAPQLQRMHADDLMAAVFPDAAACLENIPGDREVPDHPLVNQTVRDCLEEAMDLPGLIDVLQRIHRGELRLVSRDTPEPSVFADEILTARPYAFMDDAPLEERRAQAVQMRRPGDAAGAGSALDLAAIDRVRDEVRPDPRDADELHDALLTVGLLGPNDIEAIAAGSLFASLAAAGRATCVRLRSACDATVLDDGAERGVVGARAFPVADPASTLWVAAERLPELLAIHPGVTLEPAIAAPPSRATRSWTRDAALVELVRGRMTIAGPTTTAALAAQLAVPEAGIDSALLTLESEGAILRGTFTPETGWHGAAASLEWCDRRLLARIHRYTLNRLRAEISPVNAAEFMRFLFAWQHVDPSTALSGLDGLRSVVAQLDGVALPARAWEREVLPSRLDRYDPAFLDMLCLTGAVGWGIGDRSDRSGRSERSERSSRDDSTRADARGSGPDDDAERFPSVVGATPLMLFLREHADVWLAPGAGGASDAPGLGADAQRLLECLRARGASFEHELSAAASLRTDGTRAALAELVAAGLVTSDGFAGLRSLIAPAPTGPRPVRIEAAGRWSALAAEHGRSGTAPRRGPSAETVEAVAWALLRRYGVVFRRVLAREHHVPWRDLARVYRLLEARGEIRGGRFVSGMSGEQFALPDAVEKLRETRRSGDDPRLITISAADPLNFAGILTPGERIRAVASNRIVYRNGVPVAAMEGDMLRSLSEVEPDVAAEAAAAAAGRRVPVVRGFVGRLG